MDVRLISATAPEHRAEGGGELRLTISTTGGMSWRCPAGASAANRLEDIPMLATILMLAEKGTTQHSDLHRKRSKSLFPHHGLSTCGALQRVDPAVALATRRSTVTLVQQVQPQRDEFASFEDARRKFERATSSDPAHTAAT